MVGILTADFLAYQSTKKRCCRDFKGPLSKALFQESRMRGDFVPTALQSLMEKQDLGDLKRVVELGSFMHFRL